MAQEKQPLPSTEDPEALVMPKDREPYGNLFIGELEIFADDCSDGRPARDIIIGLNSTRKQLRYWLPDAPDDPDYYKAETTDPDFDPWLTQALPVGRNGDERSYRWRPLSKGDSLWPNDDEVMCCGMEECVRHFYEWDWEQDNDPVLLYIFFYEGPWKRDICFSNLREVDGRYTFAGLDWDNFSDVQGDDGQIDPTMLYLVIKKCAYEFLVDSKKKHAALNA